MLCAAEPERVGAPVSVQIASAHFPSVPEQHVLLRELAGRAKSAPAVPLSRHFTKDVSDVRRLKERTREAEVFFHRSGKNIGSLWCGYLDTQSFLTELEACEKSIGSPIRRVSATVSLIPLNELTAFCDRANAVLSRLNSPKLSDAQAEYLSSSALAGWKEELQNWTADTVSADCLLNAVEQYELTGGMTDMATLFRLASRMSFSCTAAYRDFGKRTLDLYGGANVKIYISEVLLNHLLPVQEPEAARFRETIQGQPVVGRRYTNSEVKMTLIPDEQRLLLSLDVSGNIQTASRASAFATTLFNRGQAEYEAHRKIELTREGFQLSPCEVKIPKNRVDLTNIKTNFDRVPLLSGMVRSIVLNQYEERQSDAKAETQLKMRRQVRARIEQETEETFLQFNRKFQEFSQTAEERFGLTFEPRHSATQDDWLLTSWTVQGQDTLCGSTPCPETPSGSFADVKIHESVLNMLAGKLGLEGKKAAVGELRKELAEKFNRPALAEPGENDDVEIGFAEDNPLVIRFTDRAVSITLNVKSLRLAGQTHRDFTVNVRYLPVKQEDGLLVLERDKYISLVNAQRRSQIPLRAAFGVIFSANKTFPLSVKLLETDPRFTALTAGQCRIQDGWFAVALVEK
ncbi:MAG: hypothetical protein LBN39_04265 [Planctomycetaceae bacterium]|nr:hypothetical protein [Planctomycetaceae bacterium]